MKKPNGLLFLFTGLLFISCNAQKNIPAVINTTEIAIAFPGAEGFGKYTTGGRGGRVVQVTNLEDDGPGSFRKAAATTGKRIIVFTVSGTIRLKSKLNIKGDVTIAGQTAPGDGICIADHPVVLSGDNAIIRYMRFRMGDRYQNKGMTDGSGADDAFGVTKRKNVIVDHCSISWSTDEAFSAYGGDSTTLQWNIIAEPLNYSYHFEKGDKDFENHGYGGIWGGEHLTAYGNLMAHCISRTPRLNGKRLGATQDFIDFANNVIYNWGHNNIYGGEEGKYNIINNYYKPGPNTQKSVRSRIVNPSVSDGLGFGNFYVDGNIIDGDAVVTGNNIAGVHVKSDDPSQKQKILVQNPFEAEPVAVLSADKALQQVLAHAGASLNRDTLDERIIKDVQNGTGRIIDVQGSFPHGTVFERTIIAWPVLKGVTVPLDTDKDGMPDDWEIKNKLNPNNADDASVYSISKSYTNIEMYINSLVR